MTQSNKPNTGQDLSNFCICRGCRAKFEAEPLQSRIYCRLCRPPSMVQPMCFHSVSLHVPCEQCKAMYGGSSFMRFIPKPPPQKRGPKPGAARAKKITLTRMRAVTSPISGEGPLSANAVRREAV